ncbi:DUF3291 domain-containing protein [Streptomyces sp. SP18CS02]|uniref:DUF3291 domain-containing protein n=1 Tax=Streptomyces sp. SP18CS02 TaxID=3002531 RepID=UPI002E76A195|nr:DUF3291 domain-containing protein [Streptomyces sp. SP18CS02]MEE1755468.1 DUF3291 domain-containing protein [Streptomyces sp. SP18CS02]
MPTIPWVTPNPAPPGATAVVMASRFEVRSVRDVPRFFLKSLSAWGQVRKAPGALGASLEARPLKRTFYTLSAWQDREALYAYARAEPHRGIMTGLRRTMCGSAFTFWEVPVSDLPIGWDEAKRRLAEQAAEQGA